jgi:hypothetical protein
VGMVERNVGKGPERWFNLSCKLLMLFKLANVEGMGPSNELLERSNRRSFVKFPISTGSCPEMLLSCRILLTFNRIDENV